jgi:uncharacterized membrane protein
MDTVEILLEEFVRILALALEFTSALCIAVGFVKAFILLLKRRQAGYSPLYNRLRLLFGGWLALALEFQLASDIVNNSCPNI